MNQEAWNEVAGQNSGITVQMLDELITTYQKVYKDYEAAKKVSTELYKIAEEMEGKVVEALQLAGKSKYVVEGLGTVYFMDRMVVPTPKTIENKKMLFDYLRSRHGDTFLLDKLSINHQTLQKLYNDEVKEALEGGNTAFTVPGLEQPTSMRSLGFRKERE